MKNNTYIAIMAGGIGSRFWPSSRTDRPKQFLDILGVGRSLLQLTWDRFLKLAPADQIFVLTNKQYRDLVLEQLPDLTPNQVLSEPSRNNTAPCVAYTALKLQQINPDANLVVAPSDHIILNEEEFVRTLRMALDFSAKQDALLTLGIQPVSPHTGYGYIQFDHANRVALEPIHKVLRFTEKPPLEQARQFLKSGDYLWNAGIFVWRVQAVLEAYRRYAPEIYQILSSNLACYNTAAEQTFIDEAYPRTPNISIDYAIMEKADNIYTLPSAFGWSDLGSWAALYDESAKDGKGNVVTTPYRLLEDVEGCMIHTGTDRLVAIKGLKDYIIVDEEDVLLIYPKSDEQGIKSVNQEAERQFGKLFL